MHTKKMRKYLDSNGISYLWQKIKSEITDNSECEKVLFETENITLQPNKFYYNPNAISSLDVSLDFEEGVANTYFVEFKGNDISLLLPSYIRWENDIIPDFSKSYYKYTIKIQDDVAYVIDKIIDDSLILIQYFYIESCENSNTIDLGSSTWIGQKSSQVEYSIDKVNWNPLNINSYTINKGEKMYFRCVDGNIEKNNNDSSPLLNPSKTFNIGGDISTVIYGEENVQTIINSYAMGNLFYNTKVVNTSKLLLPATELAKNCYYRMFWKCSSLTTAPELPATTLADGCYKRMFWKCSSLTTAPELLATTSALGCCENMFDDCTSLTTAPELLPATILTENCYYYMFRNCSSLTTAPELPATTLAKSCYSGMFHNCTSLTTAPELPATTLAERCYYGMFYNCNNLNYIKCLATDISADFCTEVWVNGVASTGTFIKHHDATWSTGISGIPNEWEVVDAEI